MIPPLTDAQVTLRELQDEKRRECNFFVNGQCSTRACLVRGGWRKPGDPANPTCKERQQVAALDAALQRLQGWQPIDVKLLRGNSHATFSGGHRTPETIEAFHHGMDTICNIIDAHQRGESTKFTNQGQVRPQGNAMTEGSMPDQPQPEKPGDPPWQFTREDYLREAEALETQMTNCAADRAEWAKDGHWDNDEPCAICTLQRDHAAMLRDAATHCPQREKERISEV